MAPPEKIYRTSEFDLIWHEGLSRCNKDEDLEVRSSGIRLGPKSDESVFIRHRKGEDTERHTEEGHMKMEAESRVMLPQAEEYQEPLDTGRDKEESSSRACRGNKVLLTLDFRLLAFRTVRE